MAMMDHGRTPQVKHVLVQAAIAGATALPASHMGQCVLDRHALPPLGSPPWGLLLRSPLTAQLPIEGNGGLGTAPSI
jgi:hypothetical protein